MLKSIYTVLSNIKIAKNTFEMKLSGDISHITAPGQFVNIQLDGFYLRRPISVCDADDGVLTIIYKTVGHGTEYMSGLPEGHKLDILTGLGNGYDLKKSGSSPLLIGGGAGVPPMYMLCRLLTNEGKKCTVIPVSYTHLNMALDGTSVGNGSNTSASVHVITAAVPNCTAVRSAGFFPSACLSMAII